MKVEYPEDYDKYLLYDFNNRISYDEDADSLYIYVAPPQGQVGSVLVYRDEESMVTIDTDEVNTQVGVEVFGVLKLMEKFKLDKIKNN